MNDKPYFPNLDATRFFAFILVFLAHGFITTQADIRESSTFQFVFDYGKLGFLGLEYFFVLSSFLISYLMIQEIETKKRFRLKNFLIRRALRVWPLYFLVVAVGYGSYFVANHYLNLSLSPLPNIAYFLAFIINFYAIDHNTYFLFFLVFLWSISIEEQFYLFWAFLMKFYRKKTFTLICFFLILSSLIFRFYYLNHEKQLYFNTISTLGNFGLGGLAAYVSYYKTSLFNKIKNLSSTIWVVFYVILIASIVFFHELRKFDSFIIFQRSCYALLFAIFILEQAFAKNRLFEFGNNRIVTHLGKISYGLYCFHGIVITILIKGLENINYNETYWDVFVLFPSIILLLTIAISTASYAFYEKPFLQLKKRY